MKISAEKLAEIISKLPNPDEYRPGFTLSFPVTSNIHIFDHVDFVCERLASNPINKSENVWTIEIS